MNAGWTVRRLGDLLEVQNGYAFDSKEFNPTKGMPLIRIRSLKAGVETETRFSGHYEKKYVVNAGDLLIGMDGEFGCYAWKGEPALLNQRVCRLQGFALNLAPRFLFYGVNSYLKAIEDVTGFTTVKHISSKQILDIEFPIPPFPEQQRIVTLLDEAFDGIATAKANAEKNLQNARAILESHLQSALSARGEGWRDSTFGEICVFSQGTQVDVKLQSELKQSDDQVRFLRIVDFTQGDEPPRYIDNPGAKFIVSASDIALVRYGASTGFVCSGLDGAIANNLFRVIPNSTLLDSEYLLWFLRSPLFQDEIKQKMNGAAMPAISFGMIDDIDFPLPSLTDQATLVEVLNELALEIRHLESICQQKLTALDELKKSLLHRAFNGEL